MPSAGEKELLRGVLREADRAIGRSLDDVWTMSGRCLNDVLTMSGQFLDGRSTVGGQQDQHALNELNALAAQEGLR